MLNLLKWVSSPPLARLRCYCSACWRACGWIVFAAAYQSSLPSLVERENLLEGNSKLAMSGAAAEIAGPSLTGILVQLITAPIAILIYALSLLLSAVSVILIRKSEP